MACQNILAAAPGGRVNPARFVPPRPPDIPIMPGVFKAKRRVPVGLIVVLVIAGLFGLVWLNVWYSDYDSKRIDPVVTQAVLARAGKGTQIPVTLWGGPRILQIRSALINRQPGRAPDTIVICDVIDLKTGTKDPKYANGADTLIEGVAITIR
jgi:hypothetical protein